MPDNNGWSVLVGVLLGFGTGAINDWLKDRRAQRRDDRAREREVAEKKLTARNDFQRSTLLQLQEDMRGLIRAAARVNHVDRASAAEGIQWRHAVMPDALDEQFRELQARTSMIASRCRDDRVRDLTALIKSLSAGVCGSSNQRESDSNLRAAGDRFSELNEQIGFLLRENDSL